MSASDYLEDAVLDHIFGGPNYIRPATLYIALSTAFPGDDGSSIAEPVGNGYARVAVTNDATEWPASSSSTKTHANDIIFPVATGSWGTVDYYCTFDAPSGGNMLTWGSLNSSKTIDAGEQPTFLAGSLEFQMS